MDVQKQIDYWRTGSEEDIGAAEVLFETERYRHALFFAHLAVEKALKAHVAKRTGELPPKIHNLIRLAEIARITLQSDQTQWLRAFNLYQLEGRYPDLAQVVVDREAAAQRMARAKEFILWLTAQL